MASSESRLIDPPIKVMDKVKLNGPAAVTDSVLEKAEMELLSLADEYQIHAAEDIEGLRQIFTQLSAAETDHGKFLSEIFGIAHNIKGKGGTFGYDLTTNIANQLCRFIEDLSDQPNAFALKLIELHIDALARVNSDNLAGDGGAEGNSLLQGLYEVHDKWSEISKIH